MRRTLTSHCSTGCCTKERKKLLEVKEVQVSARKVADDKGNLQGGLSTRRHEMLLAIRTEETWQDLHYTRNTILMSLNCVMLPSLFAVCVFLIHISLKDVKTILAFQVVDLIARATDVESGAPF